MANWYSGVLKYVISIFVSGFKLRVPHCFSTGKRRYGHPALNGVLPEPWLPLKKGQTLVNNDHRGDTPRAIRDNQAVVLTLRKRYSMVRGGTRQLGAGNRDFILGGPSNGVGTQADDGVIDPTGINNPWEDARPRSQRAGSATLNHRLSFDVASGVIMLPDDGDWLVEDLDSDEEDFGIENTGGLERSITESPLGDEEGGSSPLVATNPASPSRTSRYGTYFHHPERRKQPIPGAFPGR
jgi:hypothetical protein